MEPRDDALARFERAVAEWASAIYVTHGTALTSYLAARFADLDPSSFRAAPALPGAWAVDGATLRRLS